MKQISFGFNRDYKKEFGGSLLIGKRKSTRPLSTKHPIHLVLKAEQSGVFNPTQYFIADLIKSQAKKFGIKLYDHAVNWSHIHLLIKIESRQDYNKFIRSLTSILVQKVKDKFPELETIFNLRPFTRIVSWGRDFKKAFDYVILNQMESMGFFRTKKKKTAKNRTRRKSDLDLEK